MQVGTPVDVWQHPADAWTAAFLGFGAPLAGALRARLGGAGDHDVVLRPDAVHLDPNGELTGVVRAARFANAFTERMLGP